MSWMVKDTTLDEYIAACEDAAQDQSNFKRDPRYTRILEHASYAQGYDHLQNIKRDNPQLLKVPGILDNDTIGNPVKKIYHEVTASPSTLQYIGVLSNLIKLFGPLDQKRIVEIGGGYGGQCLIIHTVFTPRSYDIVDLKPALDLQNAYLSNFGIAPYLNDIIPLPPASKEGLWDLCIANYSLSEVKEPLQGEYVRMICKYSKHGYITCNGEIPAIDWGKRMSDINSERKDNFIITW